MNHRMRRIVETLACERRYGIADAKGSEYSGAGSTYKEIGADTLANFKKVSERIGGTPEQVLVTYLLKHIDSITTMVREAAKYSVPAVKTYASGEGIVSRLDDARNYLDLLECLLIDNGHISDADLNQPTVPCNQAEFIELGRQHLAKLDAEREKNPTPYGVNEKTFATLEEATAYSASLSDNMVECLDGVWRPAATKDESVKNPGEVQTPIFAQPTQDSVRSELDYMADRQQEAAQIYGETGEL